MSEEERDEFGMTAAQREIADRDVALLKNDWMLRTRYIAQETGLAEAQVIAYTMLLKLAGIGNSMWRQAEAAQELSQRQERILRHVERQIDEDDDDWKAGA